VLTDTAMNWWLLSCNTKNNQSDNDSNSFAIVVSTGIINTNTAATSPHTGNNYNNGDELVD